jgi:hypothetical protein
MLKHDKPELTTQPQKIGEKITIPEVYTNAVMTNMTPYEFEITMGLGSNNYEGVRPVVNIRMSPQFAKEFSDLFLNNIKLFEQRFGEIPKVRKVNEQ